MIRYEVTFFEKKWGEVTKTYCIKLENCYKYNPISIRKMEGKRHHLKYVEVIK